MRRRVPAIPIVILLVSAFHIFTAWGGGWAVVTLSELPENLTAGEPVTIRFAVRQHGQRLLGGLDAQVAAYNQSTGEALRVEALPDEVEGYYQATVAFPGPGTWTWSIHTFGIEHAMPDLTIRSAAPRSSPLVAGGLQAAAIGVSVLLALFSGYLILSRKSRTWAAALLVLALVSGGYGIASLRGDIVSANASVEPSSPDKSLVERGKKLFVAKGCTTCHLNQKVDQNLDQLVHIQAPDLTTFSSDPEYLKLWLEDPKTVKPQTQMPDLELSEAEIEALAAFINAPPDKVKPACPVTEPPEPPFTPPGSYGALELDDAFWYGSEALWTRLLNDGIWADLPHDKSGYTQKLFFWRVGFDPAVEPVPDLVVTGKRLDAQAPQLSSSPKATHGTSSDLGSFMLTGVDFPTPGCWELTGSYQGEELRFVIQVEP